MKEKILVAEDHDYLRNYIKKILVKENYQVSDAASGKEALTILKDEEIDLILLDLDLGDMTGTEIIKLLRRQNNTTPIIVISSFEQIDSKVNAFDLGCDDYITKPFYKEELLARIRRLSKRVNFIQSSTNNKVHEDISLGPFKVDYKSCTVFRNDKPLTLNRKLFDIMAFFIENNNQIITKDQLLSRFWSDQSFPSENTLSVHIHMLREQMETNPRNPEFLLTMRGKGYMIKIV
ncbi:MAG: response regulator transcription factor [Spirochaetales bacterium]|nr:response regulator transcription factor [Spirochaetales bacterium]